MREKGKKSAREGREEGGGERPTSRNPSFVPLSFFCVRACVRACVRGLKHGILTHPVDHSTRPSIHAVPSLSLSLNLLCNDPFLFFPFPLLTNAS